jgi:hypothetical protein
VAPSAAALAELDGDALLPASIENALTGVLGVAPTPLDDGLRQLVAGVPEQPPAGRGAIRRRRYWADIEGASRPARALRDLFRRRATHVLSLDDGPPEGQLLKKGTLLSARVPLRGFVALRVAEVTPETVTALTVEGDPLAGVVTVAFRDAGRGVRVEVVVEAAAATLLDTVLAGAGGGALEDLDWPAAIERIVALSGGRSPAGVQRAAELLDETEAARVRERAERLRVARQRAQAPSLSARRRSPTRAPRGRPRTSAGPPSPARGPGRP